MVLKCLFSVPFFSFLVFFFFSFFFFLFLFFFPKSGLVYPENFWKLKKILLRHWLNHLFGSKILGISFFNLFRCVIWFKLVLKSLFYVFQKAARCGQKGRITFIAGTCSCSLLILQIQEEQVEKKNRTGKKIFKKKT